MKVIGAAVKLIILAPYLVLKVIARNKVLIFIAIAIVIFLVVQGRIKGGGQDTPLGEIPPYQIIAPPGDVAPIVVKTQSRVYYVALMHEGEAVITLVEWYSYDADRWQLHDTPLPLNKADVKIYHRG